MTVALASELDNAAVLTDRPGKMEGHPPRERLQPARLARHHGRLYRAAFAMCGSREDAEDLVQETFERVLRRPRFVKRDHDLAYLLRVLRHTRGAQARIAARRRTAPAPPEEFESLIDARAGPEQALDARMAYAAIAELSEPLRATIVAVDVVGLSYKEAARSLRTRTGTIMSRLYRDASKSPPRWSRHDRAAPVEPRSRPARPAGRRQAAWRRRCSRRAAPA